VVAADLEERRAARDEGGRHEPGHPAGPLVLGRHGVEPAARLDDHAPDGAREPSLGAHPLDRPLERAGLPPRVVVAERDELGAARSVPTLRAKAPRSRPPRTTSTPSPSGGGGALPWSTTTTGTPRCSARSPRSVQASTGQRSRVMTTKAASRLSDVHSGGAPVAARAAYDVRVPRFHHLWIVEAELEVRNPAPGGDPRGERIYDALMRYASDETEPYPIQCQRNDDGWLELAFPVWCATRFAALAAGSAMLSEACAHAGADIGVVRLAAGESTNEIEGYRERFQQMEASQ
jgi:hypothetical protein